MVKMMILLLGLMVCIHAEAIDHIRWGSKGGPNSGLTITWKNAGMSDSIRWGFSPNQLSKSQSANRRSGYSEYFYDYSFIAVRSNSVIYYTLFDSNLKSWTPVSSFNTANSADSESFTFLALGDSRTNLEPWNKISNLANSKKSDFSIFTGDIVYDGRVNSYWDNWFNNGREYLKNHLVYHCIGNHDATDTTKFQNNFTLPSAQGTELYYFFKYSNALFICLNTENITTEQTDWLYEVLEDNKSVTWKIVFFHRPFFTIGKHSGEMDGELNTWWTAFDRYGVDLILNGHDHMYERTKPINRTVSTTEPVESYGSNEGQGRCQIVCGGAGAPLYDGTPKWFIESFHSTYSFCRFDINGNTLTDSTFDINGNLIDNFTISKSSTSADASKIKKFYTINVSPNPNKGKFRLSYKSPATGEVSIKIFDLGGKMVFHKNSQKSIEEFEEEINSGNLKQGSYFVQVSVGNQSDRSLFVLQ